MAMADTRLQGQPDYASAAPGIAAKRADAPGARQTGAKPAKRERFIPLTRQALFDRLTRPAAWPDGNVGEARRFFRYLSFWRAQTYVARLFEMDQTYETFSPDSDLLITRKFTAHDRHDMQKRFVTAMAALMNQANYDQIDARDVDIILTKDSHYGLDLHVDMAAFEEILIFCRGRTTRTETRRDRKRFFLKKEEFEVPIFQRLFILFKLKPQDARVREVMAEQRCDRKEAEKIVAKLRALLPPQVKSDYIYMKLFKNIPRTDIEMVFPNTRVMFRRFDKVKLGVTGGAGLGAGVFGAAGKIAVFATNPLGAAGAALGLGGIAFRQAMNFVNQKNRYMVTMAQNLYFHAMADNRGVMTLIADRAVEEDLKEEMLLYAILAKEPVNVRDLHEVDTAIEQYLLNTFGIDADFDIPDALGRLLADGIVTQRPDGTLDTLTPKAASDHIDKLWDSYLDHLPDTDADEGVEFDASEDARG